MPEIAQVDKHLENIDHTPLGLVCDHNSELVFWSP
jgi:hypothetical protein